MSKIKRIVKATKEILQDESRTFARSPRHFSAKDWKSTLIQTFKAIRPKRISVLAAGVAYFATLAIFPAIAALVAVGSLVIPESFISDTVKIIESYLPSDLAYLITTQFDAALKNPSSSFYIVVSGFVISLFILSTAASHAINAGNAMYETTETRPYFKLRRVSILLVVLGGSLFLILLGLLILNERWLMSVGVPGWVAFVILVLRWVVIAGIAAFGLSAFYRYAPNRSNPHWQWVTWGSSIATIVWLLGTTIFFVYARYLAHYTEAYSVFAGVLVLMIWFYLSAFAMLIGAEINYRLENQTRAKTTD